MLVVPVWHAQVADRHLPDVAIILDNTNIRNLATFRIEDPGARAGRLDNFGKALAGRGEILVEGHANIAYQ